MDQQSQEDTKRRQRRNKESKDATIVVTYSSTSSSGDGPNEEENKIFDGSSSQENVKETKGQTPQGPAADLVDLLVVQEKEIESDSLINSLLALEQLTLEDSNKSNDQPTILKEDPQFEITTKNNKKAGQKQVVSQRKLINKELKSVEKPKQKIKIAGLSNVGNTCYINSIVQCLKSAQDFSNYVISKEWESKVDTVCTQMENLTVYKEGSDEVTLLDRQLKFLETLSNLLQQMSVTEQAGGGVIIPEDFLTACHDLNQEFVNGNQQDAVQFLDETLEAFDTVLQKKNVSIFRNLFMGSHNSVLMDVKSGQRRIKRENFFCLRLPIFTKPLLSKIAMSADDENIDVPVSRKRRFVTLQECIQEYLREENLETADDSKECQKKKLELVHLPKYLFVQLKRLGFDKQTFEPTKDNTQVKFDLVNIDLSTYLVDINNKGEENVTKFVYDVIGVVHHYGQAYGGHYKAFCKSDGKWIKYSDDVVRECQNESAIATQNAYVLLLERRDDVVKNF